MQEMPNRSEGAKEEAKEGEKEGVKFTPIARSRKAAREFSK